MHLTTSLLSWLSQWLIVCVAVGQINDRQLFLPFSFLPAARSYQLLVRLCGPHQVMLQAWVLSVLSIDISRVPESDQFDQNALQPPLVVEQSHSLIPCSLAMSIARKKQRRDQIAALLGSSSLPCHRRFSLLFPLSPFLSGAVGFGFLRSLGVSQSVTVVWSTPSFFGADARRRVGLVAFVPVPVCIHARVEICARSWLTRRLPLHLESGLDHILSPEILWLALHASEITQEWRSGTS